LRSASYFPQHLALGLTGIIPRMLSFSGRRIGGHKNPSPRLHRQQQAEGQEGTRGGFSGANCVVATRTATYAPFFPSPLEHLFLLTSNWISFSRPSFSASSS